MAAAVEDVLLPARGGMGSPLKPIFVEVNYQGLVIHPVGTSFEQIFADKIKRIIPKDAIVRSDEFRKLLEHIRREKRAIITFLLRPDAIDVYKAAEANVRKFEIAKTTMLIEAILPSGQQIIRSLSGVVPLPGSSSLDFSGVLGSSGRPPRPRPPMIDPQTGKPQLAERCVFVTKGRIIPVIDPDDQMADALKNRIQSIITSKRLPVSENNTLPTVQVANIVIDEFNKNPPQLKNFNTTLKLVDQKLTAVLTPANNAGEGPEEAAQGWFGRCVLGTQRKYYLNFLVTPDSFKEYPAIRELTEEEQFFAGWQPLEELAVDQDTGFLVNVKTEGGSLTGSSSSNVVPNVLD